MSEQEPANSKARSLQNYLGEDDLEEFRRSLFGKRTVVNFTQGRLCKPCIVLDKVIDKLEQEGLFGGEITVLCLDAFSNLKITQSCNVWSTPVLIAYDENAQIVGKPAVGLEVARNFIKEIRTLYGLN